MMGFRVFDAFPFFSFTDLLAAVAQVTSAWRQTGAPSLENPKQGQTIPPGKQMAQLPCTVLVVELQHFCCWGMGGVAEMGRARWNLNHLNYPSPPPKISSAM